MVTQSLRLTWSGMEEAGINAKCSVTLRCLRYTKAESRAKLETRPFVDDVPILKGISVDGQI